MSGRATIASPTMRELMDTQIGGMSSAALPAATRPTPKMRAAATAEQHGLAGPRRRVGVVGAMGIDPGLGPGAGLELRLRRWSVERVGGELDVAGRDVRPGGLDGGEDDPVAMTTRSSAALSTSVSPSATAMSAPTPPSVATIGATIETLPMVRALYVAYSPAE